MLGLEDGRCVIEQHQAQKSVQIHAQSKRKYQETQREITSFCIPNNILSERMFSESQLSKRRAIATPSNDRAVLSHSIATTSTDNAGLSQTATTATTSTGDHGILFHHYVLV